MKSACRIRWTLFTLLWAILATCSPLAAQEVTGSIRGEVLDPSGAGVPGAKVTATQAETGFQRTTTSGHDGSYLLVLLPVGHYRLEASATGFRKYAQEEISLSVNEAATVEISLQIGTETQTVEVQANAALIETTSTMLGKTVGEREILDLPLNGRNFSQLGLLQPGVVPITPGLAEAGGSLRAGIAASDKRMSAGRMDAATRAARRRLPRALRARCVNPVFFIRTPAFA